MHFLKSVSLYKNNRVQKILSAFKQFRTHSINFEQIYLLTFAHDQKWDFPQQNGIFEHIQSIWMCSIYIDFKIKTLMPKKFKFHAMDPIMSITYGKIEKLTKWYFWVSDWISKILSAKRHKTMKLFIFFLGRFWGPRQSKYRDWSFSLYAGIKSGQNNAGISRINDSLSITSLEWQFESNAGKTVLTPRGCWTLFTKVMNSMLLKHPAMFGL